MPSITSLVKQLKASFPNFNFREGETFLWSHPDNTIYYNPSENDGSLLLHELAHAVLGHADYKRDVELLAMERMAWDKVKELAPQYNLAIDDDFVQDNLDTYRDWLHARSTCPNCGSSGMQIKIQIFSCPSCRSEWQVNEARTCALRRYKK